jgi:hypothetical protein
MQCGGSSARERSGAAACWRARRLKAMPAVADERLYIRCGEHLFYIGNK